MMNAKENYIALLNHENTDYVPFLLTDGIILGGQHEFFENGPLEGGFDGFGCNWIPTASAGGQPALDPSIILLDDVCDWEDVVKFPDLDAFDWQKMIDTQMGDNNPDEKVVEYHTWNSVFLRFSHLLGFEGALVAMFEEPEASADLMMAIADYKIRLLEHVVKYVQPDSVVHYDDVATGKVLFMSPELYRQQIKPAHKKINDAARELGMIPQIHCCGYCTDIIPDFIDEGAVAWQAAQPSNDICSIIEKYGDELSVIGGFDSNGAPGMPDTTPERISAEVDRCFDEYGKYGKAYGFFGFFLGSMDDPATMQKYGVMIQKVLEHRGIQMPA
ncbi:MAG: uroporphyrinogen decarboxylase family protein [Coriobacteriales bacterium]|jgi:hypothetical protein